MDRSEDDSEKNVRLRVLSDTQSEEKRKTTEFQTRVVNRSTDERIPPDISYQQNKEQTIVKSDVRENTMYIYSHDTCPCKKEHPNVETVCITCKEKLCSRCTSNHGSTDKQKHELVYKTTHTLELQPVKKCDKVTEVDTGFSDSQVLDKGSTTALDEGITHDRSRGSVINEHKHATHFCKTREERELSFETYRKQHTRQERISDQMMNEKKQGFTENKSYARDDRTEIGLLCFPCSVEEFQIKATQFCITCKDPMPLCDTCAVQHLRKRNSRNHELSLDMRTFRSRKLKTGMDIKQREHLICHPCFIDDMQLSATHFCKTCVDPEPLCETCAKEHIKQKMSRYHEICENIRTFPSYKPQIKFKTKQKKEMLCEPCSLENLQKSATNFCKTCESPEPLCETCAMQHIRQKLSRDHEICRDISEFPEPGQHTSENTKDDTGIACNPCSYDGTHAWATQFCRTCEEPEPFCGNCAKQHIRQKKFRKHEICGDIKNLKHHFSIGFNRDQAHNVECGPCLHDNEKVRATHFCKTCADPEPFCKTCAKQHTRQKTFKDHTICENIREFLELQSIQRKIEIKDTGIDCNPCFYDQKKAKATHFCKTCKEPEPFCENCAKQHIRQKHYREHEICEDMEMFHKHEQNTGPSGVNVSGHVEKEETEEISIPGQPTAKEIRSDSVDLFWDKSESKVDYYQIRYKTRNGQEKWKFAETDNDCSKITITGLMAKTKYVFQVRGVYQDQEGKYGLASDVVSTTESLATYLLTFSEKVTTGSPSKYRLLVEELEGSRNTYAKTKQVILGELKQTELEKTIMLVGATGSGKSTLVDGIVNYVMGVSFEDPFRFTLLQLEKEEQKFHNQAVSQTEWITVYKIMPRDGSRLKYILNIIDTPGFGDTRGIERDQGTIDQIRELFSETGNKGVLYLDAVCFIVKAPDARLTVSQRYIFSSIMSLFGKDIESNICTLITFADGAEPPVLASLKEADLPFGSTFQFNNSALYAKNKQLASTSLSPMFWDMGCKSFQKFFDEINHFQTRSLSQTKDVLQERDQLKNIIAGILPQVKAGLMKLSELREEIDIFKKHKDDIENNKDFEYEVEETIQVMVSLAKGHHVTNCIQCNFTCHDDCQIKDDDDKSRCCAMKDGFCTVCSNKCRWNDHKNRPYKFDYVVKTVKKTYTEMKQKYEKAIGSKLTHESFIEELSCEIESLFNCVNERMTRMNRCKTRLKEIALRPDPLSTVEHLDLMIQAEEHEKQPGYLKRIEMLYEFRHMAEVDKDFENFGADYISTRLEIASCGINSNAPNKGNRGNNDNKRGIFSSLASWFTLKSNQQKQGKK